MVYGAAKCGYNVVEQYADICHVFIALDDDVHQILAHDRQFLCKKLTNEQAASTLCKCKTGTAICLCVCYKYFQLFSFKIKLNQPKHKINNYQNIEYRFRYPDYFLHYDSFIRHPQ